MSKHTSRITALFVSAQRGFGRDRRGNVAVLFGLMSLLLFAALGGGIDFARAYLARQKLSQVATLACQYASRPAIVDTSTSSYGGSNGSSTYISNVNNFISTTWSTQKVNLTQTNGTPFTYTPGGAANVSLASTVPTTFIQIVGIASVPIAAQSHCYDTPASIPQRVPDSGGQFVVKESFELGGVGGWQYIKPNGQIGTQAVPTAYTSAIGYTGTNGTQWHITGYCLEQDQAGVIKSNVADGNFSVELDCDNGTGSSGNSSITTQVYLATGAYELRYNYASRVFYPNYDPTYLCGSTASDLSWANDTTAVGGPLPIALRTNQLNVYLDLNNAATNKPPTHMTIDGTQTLDGSNLIDMCVYSFNWIERSVSINVTTPGYYWLTFAGDGTSESYGAQLDNIRLCRVMCPGTVQDNFPSAWAGSKVLFAENFQTPVYTQDPFITEPRTKGGNLALSLGTTGTASSGWPSQAASGWAVAPYNQMTMWVSSAGMTGSSPGTQFPSFQGWNGFSNPSDPLNRSISRKFLLDPGYYKVSYIYTSLTDFSYDFWYGINCTAAPTSANNLTAYGKKNGHKYGDPVTVYNQYLSTNFLNVYMANGQLVSTPNVNAVLGGAPTYSNPDGTTSATPTVPLDSGGNFAAYSASAVNPVIDTCNYSSGFAWTPRSVNVKITKSGWYWLDFSSLGDPITALGGGPGVDAIQLTALSSLYGSVPSSPVVPIPVPDPQPGATISYTGFTITADPLTP